VPTIISASLGTPTAYQHVLIVAAAGNLGTSDPVYPAAFDSVVAVGALTDDLSPAPFSSRGGHERVVRLLPGTPTTRP
jgi:subtilisin family serine protease